MREPTCVFKVLNSRSEGLTIWVEPEAHEFLLPSGESIEVRLFGKNFPNLFEEKIDDRGRPWLVIWPDGGDVEVFYKGTILFELN